METPAMTAGSAVPQLELDFAPRPAAPDTESSPDTTGDDAPANEPPRDEARRISALAQQCVTALGDIIGECVNETLEAVLERQEARLVELLESQERRHAADMARLAEANAENLRSILREVLSERPSLPTPQPAEAPQALTTEAVADLQETLRVGLGNVRAGLNQHHNELMAVVRNELRPLAQAALAWLTSSSPSTPTANKSPEPPATAPAHEPVATRTDSPPPTPTACASPGRGPPKDATPPPTSSRSPPPERSLTLTAAQRAHVHLSIYDECDEHGEDADPRDDPDLERPPRRQHPDDRQSSLSEASP